MPLHNNISGAYGYEKGYEQGYKDGQEALAKHIELCREEILEDIKAEIMDYRGFNVIGINAIAKEDIIEIIDKHISSV